MGCKIIGDINNDGVEDQHCLFLSSKPAEGYGDSIEDVITLGSDMGNVAEEVKCCEVAQASSKQTYCYNYKGADIFFDNMGVPFYVGQIIKIHKEEREIEAFQILYEIGITGPKPDEWTEEFAVKAVLFGGCLTANLEELDCPKSKF